MDVAGQVIFCEICRRMRGATTIYADVTTFNFNLLFEIGYAIGLGLPVRPIRDSSYIRDRRAFDALGVLDTLGYVDFSAIEEVDGLLLFGSPEWRRLAEHWQSGHSGHLTESNDDTCRVSRQIRLCRSSNS
jgi:nucleoside 2-deoxyribosyltransferase